MFYSGSAPFQPEMSEDDKKPFQNDDFNVFLFQNVYDVILKKYQDQQRKNIIKLNNIESQFQDLLSHNF